MLASRAAARRHLGEGRGREERAMRRASRAAGFTLLETAMATIIIGVGVLAILEAQQSFHKSNAWSSQAASATLLANEIREMTRRLPRHDPVTGLALNTGGGTAVLEGWGPETGEVLVGDLDDLDDFDGLSLAWDGTAGLNDGDLPGPVDAFGLVIPEVDYSGNVVLSPEGEPLPLQGWTQRVSVEKVNPFNFAEVVADGYFEVPSGEFAGRGVDGYPLRVTVVVEYQGPFDAEAIEITRVQWIVP